MGTKDRPPAQRLLIVHESRPLALHSDTLGMLPGDVHAVESLLMIDRRFRYVSADEAVSRLIGADQEDLVGQTVGLYIGLDAFDQHVRPCIEAAFAGQANAVLLLTTHLVLGPLQLVCACYPCLGADGQIDYVVMRMRDDNSQDKLGLATQRRRRRQSALYALDSALNSEARLETIATLAVHNLLDITGCCSVALRRCKSSDGLLPASGGKPCKIPVAAAASSDTTLQPGETVVLSIEEQDMRLGELELQFAQGKLLRGELRNFVDAVVERLGQALFRDMVQIQTQQYTANLERIVAERTQEVTRRRHTTVGLHEVLGMLIANEPFSVILDNIMRQAETMLGADATAILLAQHREDGTDFVRLAVDDPYSNVTNADLLAIQETIDEVVRQRRPLTGHDGKWGASADGRYHTHLLVPTIAAHAIVGITAYFFMAEREFTPDEVDTAAVLSEQVFFALESDRLQKRAREGAAIKERERLAGDLHDAVTQSIYSLSLFAEAGRRKASLGQIERVQEYLELLGETAQQAMKQMRLLLYELRPNVLEQIGLLGALQQRLDAVERPAGIAASLEVAGPFRLPAAVEEGLYRIAQEALNNALRHSSASSVQVRLLMDGDVVMLEIVDDGVGFVLPQEIEPTSIGIIHMQERAATLNADLAIETSPGMGTRVIATVLVPGIGGAVGNDINSASDSELAD